MTLRTRAAMGAVVAAIALWGCDDGGGGLPDGLTGTPPPGTCEGDCVEPPDLKGDGGYTQPDVLKSLWPLTTESTWVYRIEDPLKGTWEKNVEVVGPSTVPDTDIQAISVRSVQPHLEELSWQVVSSGIAFRIREEDRKSGTLERWTTWDPATIKSLTGEQPAGWNNSTTVHEVVHEVLQGTVDEKDKTYIWRVLAVNESVTTPAGTFLTLKVQRDRPDKTGKEKTYWLAPGVGKVKEEGERTELLLRYDIKP